VRGEVGFVNFVDTMAHEKMVQETTHTTLAEMLDQRDYERTQVPKIIGYVGAIIYMCIVSFAYTKR
jgi:hypothetical protein